MNKNLFNQMKYKIYVSLYCVVFALHNMKYMSYSLHNVDLYVYMIIKLYNVIIMLTSYLCDEAAKRQ